MYDNIGGKIKTVAKVIGFAGIGISVLAGLVFLLASFSEEEFLYLGIGILVAFLGSLISWASTIALYGFGQLIENTDVLVQDSQINKSSLRYIRKAYEDTPAPRANTANSQVTSGARYCTNCGKKVTGDFCPYCGAPDLKDMSGRDGRQ